MARTDFYILNGDTTASRFSCAIANKAFLQGNSVFIISADRNEAGIMDDLLWTYHDISFLPHALADDKPAGAPVIIGWPGQIPPASEVLINLTDTVPNCITEFNRIVEIVADDPAQKERGRERYKYYRDNGYELFSHNISKEAAGG
ncbi:MAG: DNA polymerase III subunit chi [Gammaproteobacteria bacterium]